MPCVSGTLRCRCKHKNTKALKACITTHSVIRKVWSDYALFTVEYLNATLYDIPTVSFLLTRLLDNQQDIGLEFAKHFPQRISKKIGDEMIALLKEHISLIGKTLATVKMGDDTTNAKNNLFAQSDQMSFSFSQWFTIPVEALKQEFRTHNTHILTLATILLKKKGGDYVKELDDYINHLIHIADELFEALLNQEEEKQDESSKETSNFKKRIHFFKKNKSDQT